MVKRVSARVARGLTLELALAAEQHGKINLETWHKALQKCEEFSTHYQGARGKFLEWAVAKLAADKNTSRLMWLLERRHADLFSKPEPAAAVVNVSQHVGIPADVLERAKQLQIADCKLQSGGKLETKGGN